MGKRMEEENKNPSAEIKKRIDAVTQQEDKMFEGGRYDQAMAPQVSSVWVTREIKVKNIQGRVMWGPADFGACPENNTLTLTTARTGYRFNND